MSAEQISNFRRFKQLLNDLKFYGLNPREWRIERSEAKRAEQLLLRHRIDEDFRLKGDILQVPSGRVRFSGLTVISL